MKFLCGLTQLEKIRRKEEWHTWYAWHPVWIDNDDGITGCWYWLRYIRRKGKYITDWGLDHYWEWYYIV